MYSQLCPPTQIAAVLSQVSNVVGHLGHRFSTAAFPKNAQVAIPEPAKISGKTQNVKIGKGKRQKRENHQKASSKNKGLSDLDVDKCVALLSKEDVSSFLPLLTPDSILQDQWSNSHVSADTFYENRTGFPEASLDEATRRSIQILGSDNKPLLTFHIPVFYQQRRYYQKMQGFGIKQNRPTSQKGASDAEALGDSILGKLKNTQSGNVNITIKTEEKKKFKEAINIFRYALILYIIFYILIPTYRDFKSSSPGGGPGSLNIFESHEFEAENVTVTFSDVRGVDEAKQELLDAVDFLKHPKKFQDIGAKLPKGVLLVGQPGIGKTLLAKAVAGEAGVPFFYASGAQFDDLYVGSGARKVRKLFSKAKLNAPCVIFIDEIDSAGAKRTNSSIHPYANQTINQLLSDMDGFNTSEGIIVIGATNKRGNLDDALLRPGRFDVEVNVMPPDTKGREEIFKLYLEKVKTDSELNVRKLAEASAGMTGADISNVVNQAALRAAIVGKEYVSWEHVDYALDKSRMGPAWKNKRLKKSELELTAYHEAGHTLMVLYTKDAPELNKVTILPRGQALGFTSYLPESDSYSTSKSQMLASIDILVGGRVAEELIYGVDKVTSGASSDFQRATQVATGMVKQFGMSDKVGLRTHANDKTGADCQKLIDSEIERILKESYDRVKTTLTARNKELNRLAIGLLKYGTLEKDEVLKVIKGQQIDKEADAILDERNISST